MSKGLLLLLHLGRAIMERVYVIMLFCVGIYFIYLQVYMSHKVNNLVQTYTRKNTIKDQVNFEWNTSRSNVKTLQYCDVFDPHQTFNLTEADIYECILMKTEPAVNICLYAEREHAASNSIRQIGTWEKDIGENILEALKADKNTGFIDIGASIGIHTLTAAKSGHKVIAVEPSMSNVMHLMQSIQLNSQVYHLVTIVTNAISDHRGTVLAHRSHTSGNPGLQSIVKNHGKRVVVDAYKAILMDDLLEVIDFEKAVIKLDIEGAEPLAMASAHALFKSLNISAVFMEWDYSRQYYWIGKHDGRAGVNTLKGMVDFLFNSGFKPQDNLDFGSYKFLEYSDAAQWPDDIVWVKA